jgi:type II secretory pathway pseudopilin PulG
MTAAVTANVESCEGRAFGFAPHARRWLQARLRQEGGFTLMEMLVGMLMTMAIFMAAMPVIDGATRTEGRIETSAMSVGDARVFTERVGRDLRLTDKVYSVGPTSLSVETYVRHTACGSGTPSAASDPAIQCTVTYDCSAGTCTRQEGGAAPTTVATGLSDDNVFSYPCPPNPTAGSSCPAVPNPDEVRYIGINAVLPNPSDIGGDAITLQDGTALRNVQS